MDFMDSKAKKLEEEQEKRRQAIRKQKERDEKLRQQAIEREIKERENAIIRKENEENERLEQERIDNEEYAKTGGIKFKMTLKPVLIDFEDDKIILPEQALIELNQSDAMSHGVLLFEIKIASNVSIIKFTDNIRKVTHCGVREFSSKPGTIGIPSKVLESLDIDVKSLSSVSLCVKYTRLPKITYVKFEPKMNEFFAVGPVKMCLEENLRQHSTLTVGDVLTVWYKGKSHVLSVVDMKPEIMGTLIDTDVEVDLDLSTETKQSQERATSVPLTSGINNNNSNNYNVSNIFGNRLGNTVNSNMTNSSSSNSSSISSSSSSSSVNSKQYNIPSEPPESEKENIVKVKLRLPNGQSSRRFYTHQPIKHLFEYVSSITDLDLHNIQLSSQFPPKIIGINDIDKNFNDIGINSQQELIHVMII